MKLTITNYPQLLTVMNKDLLEKWLLGKNNSLFRRRFKIVKTSLFIFFLTVTLSQAALRKPMIDHHIMRLDKIVSSEIKTEVSESMLEHILENKNIGYTTVLNNATPLMMLPSSSSSTPSNVQKTISGTVRGSDNTALIGATVGVKGTNTSTSTNEQGMFTINAPENATLVIRFVGFATQEIEVNGRTTLDVVLKGNDQEIEEVITTGYQKIKRAHNTGAVRTVKAEDVKLPSLGTIDKMLQGQVAGVAIQTTSSTFGTAPQIRIRGNSSITGINEPLWVLDGVPLESPLNIIPSELHGGNARNLLSSALANVSPDDIEDITVLMDASATAMYGTRAVNGVIIITSKRGKLNTPLYIGYNSNFTLSMKPSIREFDVLNSKDQTILNHQLGTIYENTINNFSASTTGAYSDLTSQLNRREITYEQWQQKLNQLQTVNTDWFDVIYRNTIMQQHNLSFSHGGDKVSTRFSGSYYRDPGKTIGEKVNRYTLNGVFDYNPIDRLKIETNIRYSKRAQVSPGVQVNPFNYALNTSRAMVPYTEQGGYKWYKRGYADFNIINELHENNIELSSGDFIGQLNLTYSITDKINFNSLFNTRYVSSLVDERMTEYSNYANQFRAYDFRIRSSNERLYKLRGDGDVLFEQPQNVLREGGILDRETQESLFYTWRNQMNYTMLNDPDGHRLNMFGGIEITSNKQQQNFNRNYGYLFESGGFAPSPLAYERLIYSTGLSEDEERQYGNRNLLEGTPYYVERFRRNTVGYYFSMNYSYSNRYALDLSARNDATNVSGSSTRGKFSPTWSVGAAWNLSNESFMNGIGSQYLSDIKIRGSYGLRGNAGNRGPDMIAYRQNVLRQYTQYNTGGVKIEEPENSQLDFEKEYMFSTGIDLTLMKAIDLTVNYYNRRNFDLVGYRQVAFSSGYQNKQFNWADMRNSGYEISLNIRPIRIREDFAWRGMFNLGINRNKILSDYRGNNLTLFDLTEPEGVPLQGAPIDGLYSFRFSRLDNKGIPMYLDGQGKEVLGFTTSDNNILNIEYQGSRSPIYSGGFTSTFSYKGLSLSTAFVFNAGHVVRKANYYRSNALSSLFADDLSFHGDFADRWSAPGQEEFTVYPKLLTDEDLDQYNRNGLFNESIFDGYNRNNTRTINASYLRLRNVSIQYNFMHLAKRFGVKNLSLGLEGSNLAIFSSGRLNGMDPETLLTGINMPPVTSYTFSINVGF